MGGWTWSWGWGPGACNWSLWSSRSVGASPRRTFSCRLATRAYPSWRWARLGAKQGSPKGMFQGCFVWTWPNFVLCKPSKKIRLDFGMYIPYSSQDIPGRWVSKLTNRAFLPKQRLWLHLSQTSHFELWSAESLSQCKCCAAIRVTRAEVLEKPSLFLDSTGSC